MKKLVVIGAVTAIFAVWGCHSVGPVYEFYAHRHAVPMFNKTYSVIPENAPTHADINNERYAPVFSFALNLIETHRQTIHSPGISAAVAIDGQLVWAGTSGWADLATDTPLTPASQFRIGSTSKAITATLMARLVDSGKIDIDTPLSSYKVAKRNANWAKITPRQLASHMAGMPHYKQNTEFTGVLASMRLNQHYDNVADSLGLFDESDLLSAPGEAFFYSSLGTVLLSAVLQEAAGEQYQQALQHLVFEPLEMSSSMAESAARKDPEQDANLSTFYWHPDYAKNKVAPWRDVDLSHRLAGGGLISTSSDLVKLGLGFNSEDFISPETRTAFWTPQQLNNGEVNEQNYALDWRVTHSDFGEDIGTLFHANHGGVSRGAQSWLMVIPEFDMAVAVNINGKTEQFWDFGKVSFELVRLFLSYRKQTITPRQDSQFFED